MTTPSLFEKGDAVRIKWLVEAPYGGRVGVVKDVSRHEGVLVELGSELASVRLQPTVLTHAAPNDVPGDVWRFINPPEPEPERRQEPGEAEHHVLTVSLRVPLDDLEEIDFTDTIAVLDYLAERHEDLDVSFPDPDDYPTTPY